MAKEEIILDFKVDEKDAVVSIENLAKANKELREERKKLDLQTEKGKQRAQEINKVLDQNTKVIKENVSALEKQRLNIGNYGSALDKLAPGLSGMIQGIQGGTKAALAFIATPIGAVIGALGLAVGALTSYFKGSEEGQNKLNRIMNVGSAIVGKFSDAVQFVGKVVFDNLLKAGEKVIGFLNRFVPGFEDATTALSNYLNIDVASGISDLQERQILLNRELLTQRDILKEEIEAAKVRAESTKDTRKRAEAFEEAVNKINELAQKEKELAQLQSDIQVEQAKLSNNDIEANDAIAEGKARINQLERERLSQLKEISTKQLAIREQEKAQLEKELEEQSEQDRARRIRSVELIAETESQKDIILDASFKRNIKRTDEALRASIKAGEDETKARKAEAAIQEVINQNKVQGILSVFRLTSGLAKENTILAKATGIAQATIDTYIAANRAFALGGGVPFGTVLASLTVALGLANVAKISGIPGFASGGLTGKRIGPNDGTPINRSNGDNLLATVKTGEVILNERQQAMLGGARTFARLGVPGFAGGGSLVANSSSQRIDQSMGLGNLMKGLTVQASWVEGQELGKKIEFKESLVTA